jgi:membrane protease YdiL (CAAX protease family)
MNNPEVPSPGPPPLPLAATFVGRRRWWIHLTIIGCYPVLLGALSVDRTAANGPALTHSVRGMLMVCAIQLLSFAVFFAVGWLASRASSEALLLRWRGGAWPVPLGIAYSVLLRVALGIIALTIIALLIAFRVIKPEELQTIAKANQPDVGALVDLSALQHDPRYFWLSLTLVSFVVAGFREELWRSAFLAGMRALWPTRFGSQRGQLLAVSIAAVLFGLGHAAQGPVAVFAAGLLGLGLGAIMVIHRSIWPAVLAHGFFDAGTFALLPLLAKIPH